MSSNCLQLSLFTECYYNNIFKRTNDRYIFGNFSCSISSKDETYLAVNAILTLNLLLSIYFYDINNVMLASFYTIRSSLLWKSLHVRTLNEFLHIKCHLVYEWMCVCVKLVNLGMSLITPFACQGLSLYLEQRSNTFAKKSLFRFFTLTIQYLILKTYYYNSKIQNLQF